MSFNQSNILHESVTSFDKPEELVLLDSDKEKLTKKQKFKQKLYTFLIQMKIKFLFHPTLALINYIIEKNNSMLGEYTIDLREYLFSNFDGVLKIMGYIEKFNFEALKVFKDKVVTHQISLKNFDKKFNEIFANFQSNIIPHSISFLDFSPEFRQIKPKLSEEEPVNLNAYDRLHLVIDDQICLFNVKEDENLTIDEIKVLKISDFIYLLFEVFMSTWETICFILLITYNFFNNGISCLVLFVYMFIYLIFEEKKAKIFAWKICFIYFVVVSALKMFLYLHLVVPIDPNPADENNDYIPLNKVYEYKKNKFHWIFFSYFSERTNPLCLSSGSSFS